MIIWIASYPKSGNTWIRLFLKSYLTDEEDLDINNNILIPSFPIPKFFDMLNIDYTKFTEIIKNWIALQDTINLNGETNFLKTHNGLFAVNNYKFTNTENTLGAIYVVRDPRDLVLSYAHHFGETHSEAVDKMLNHKNVEKMEYKNQLYTHSLMGRWSDHYNSWKLYNKKKKILIIKYEDLIKNTHASFLKILEYLNGKNGTEINLKKMERALNQTTFENLKKKEELHGFNEKSTNGKFFRKGKVGEWKKYLKKELVQKIETSFKNEMKELNYL